MINFALFSALATFYFTMFVTPGPNNAMLTASGMKFGFIRTLPHLIGIPLGHIFQIGLVCFGLGNLFLIYPQIQSYMKILCFLYLIYFSWKMFGSFSFDADRLKKAPVSLGSQSRALIKHECDSFKFPAFLYAVARFL